MKEELQACFVTSSFQHQNPEKSGLNAQVSRNGHIYIAIHTTNGELVYLWPLRRNLCITSLWHLLFNLCFVPGCDSCYVFLLTLLLFVDVNVVRLLRLCSCNTTSLWFVLSLHWRHCSGIPCQTTMNQCASRGADQCHSRGSSGTCLKTYRLMEPLTHYFSGWNEPEGWAEMQWQVTGDPALNAIVKHVQGWSPIGWTSGGWNSGKMRWSSWRVRTNR